MDYLCGKPRANANFTVIKFSKLNMQPVNKASSLTPLLKMLPPRIVGKMLLQIAVINGVLILGFVFLGKFLDAGLKNTKPWFTVGLILVGLHLALYITYKLGMRTAAKLNKTDEQLKEAKAAASAI